MRYALAFIVMLAGARGASAQTGSSAPSKGPPGLVGLSEPSIRIAAISFGARSDRWDDAVKGILVAAYDKNQSRSIDTEAELAAITCDVWLTMDRSIKAASPGSGLAWTYGFKPRYVYFGHALGIVETLRVHAFTRIKSCGVDIGA